MNRWESLLVKRMYEGDEQGVIQILDQGFPIDFCIKPKGSPQINFTNPLILSIELGLSRVTSWLLSSSAPVNKKDSIGRTPLILAAVKGDLVLNKQLISKGADISCKDANGNTILHVAVLNAHRSLIKYYISALKFPLRVYNFRKQTPLALAKVQIENSESPQDIIEFQNILSMLWKADFPNSATDNNRSGHKKYNPALSKISKSVTNSCNDLRCIQSYLTHKHKMFASRLKLYTTYSTASSPIKY